jgi:NAD(P)-dependent dehydrogenase (short-subunit alcohol dehydrogenase family)
MDLDGKVAVVTGGGSGIGRATCLAFARQGASVLVLDKCEASAKSVAHEISGEGARNAVLVGDVADPETSRAMVALAQAEFGRLDILVANAATVLQRGVVAMSDDEWDRVLKVNLYGPFFGAREAAQAMIAQGEGGRVLITSSLLAVQSRSLQAAYTAAKAGLVGLARVLAIELGPHRITVNCVLPGHIQTPLTEPMFTPAVRRAFEERIPLGVVGTPENIADVFAFLASDAAAYITGESILADGGYTICGDIPGVSFGPSREEL